MSIKQNVARTIRRVKEERHISIEILAKELDITKSAVQAYLKGDSNPRADTLELLAEKCARLGLGCDIIPQVSIGGVTVSSTYIRRLVELGQVDRAARFLGHPHTLTGAVRHGRGLGTTRLFPTANLVIPPHVLTPAHGVYVTRVFFPGGESRPAVTNVGTRPTVNNGRDVTVEACILDFEGDLYGQTLRLEFHRHLRDEIRFDSLEALRARIAADAETTRRYFEPLS